MEFEVFTPTVKRNNVPHIIMSKNGTLVFSSACRKKFNIPEECFAELAYNKENKRLRIKITDNNKMCQLKKWRIFAPGMYKFFGITDIGKFPFNNIDNEDKIYYVDLNDNSVQDATYR